MNSSRLFTIFTTTCTTLVVLAAAVVIHEHHGGIGITDTAPPPPQEQQTIGPKRRIVQRILEPRAPLGGQPVINVSAMQVDVTTVPGNWLNPNWIVENEIKDGFMPVYIWKLFADVKGSYHWCLADTLFVAAQPSQSFRAFVPRDKFTNPSAYPVFLMVEATRAYTLKLTDNDSTDEFGALPASVKPQPRQFTVQRSTGPCL